MFILKLLQQNLLVLVALLKQQLIESLGGRQLIAEQLLGLELFPPGTDHRAAAE
jgi:hypothetical protein